MRKKKEWLSFTSVAVNSELRMFVLHLIFFLRLHISVLHVISNWRVIRRLRMKYTVYIYRYGVCLFHTNLSGGQNICLSTLPESGSAFLWFTLGWFCKMNKGIILPARHGGGRLIFIGRHVHRGIDDDSLTIGVDPKFLDTTFTEFNITKGSASVPDVAGILDKAMGDKNQLQELSPLCILTISPSTWQASVDGTV